MKTLLLAAALVLPVLAHAQDRTAGQAFDAQVNWESLKAMFDKVDTQNKILAAAVTTMQTCNLKKMLFVGTAQAGAASDGCAGMSGGVVRVFGGSAGTAFVERNLGKWDACYISRYTTTNDNHHCDVRQEGQPNTSIQTGVTSTYMDYTPSASKNWLLRYQKARCAVTCIRYP